MTILMLIIAGLLIMAAISLVSGRRNRGQGSRRQHGDGYYGTDAAYIPGDAGATWDSSSGHHHHHDSGGSSWDGGGSFGDSGGGN
jgi:hypothetical protein